MQQVNVVLMRGLAGNVYSRGMDAVGAKLAKLPGVDYVTVEDYGSWRSIRDRLLRWRDPTIIGGHSFGANAATIIATQLRGKRNIPLLIGVDPSPYWSWSLWQSGPDAIGDNVARTVNFYQLSGLIGRQELRGRGVVNIPLSASSHTTIDDDVERVHNPIIAEVMKVIGA